ncbi:MULTISPECIES: hypothetical protein [Thermoactinomyces]|jgi:hypothetical protein|uniref:Uncharacterized protein n=1 Tax=Thermoactinomyces daqus TaxID=1329516 RepID=A0A7W1X9R8_9BACL|nr:MULTISPECIES: hypothetical protein [Thermoactinomyces]MBA4542636.1 hypothetical protein [Thermoactinomyces daqus]MBH8597385.1 hypothetical protein [Thermoactinomyces sp. CICC 10523]MBH8602946.1 hypothetical protein [Thermoactinomyces sp. CICC 10522]MBH8607206.1 hypothetical protein [Thermoactinomyces sp. CICC 10521]
MEIRISAQKLRSGSLQAVRTGLERGQRPGKRIGSLREGMRMREILGPPRALKPYRFSLFR